MVSSEPFAVMAKPVGPRCNMGCRYCYYLETEGMYGGALPPAMSLGLLEVFVRDYIQANPGPVVPFVWHGGEPTLAGLDFYRAAVGLQKRYLPEGWSVWNNIQTNGLLLDDEWCSFLAENNFDVGLSIDGTKEVHDKYRVDLGGKGTYDRVVQALGRLKAHGIRPDLLCTVTSSSAEDPVGVYRALRDMDTGWIQFIPIVRRGPDGRVTPDSVTPMGYGDFLCAAFDEWALHDIGRLQIQQVAEMGLVWSGGTGSLCWMAPECGRVLVVEGDGAVYSCDHFVSPEHRMGYIQNADLGVLVDSPAQKRFGSQKRDGKGSECRTCPWLSVCNGGCPKDRFVVPARSGRHQGAGPQPGLQPELQTRPETYYLCQGLRRFFAYVERPLRRILEQQRRGVRPEVIMADQLSGRRAMWRGVGRNDPCPCGSGKKAKNCCWARRP